MNKMNKKGFTIVELVIVIAVIAILAGVLIPTFGGIIDRANESAEMQAVAAAYKEAYALALADDGKIADDDFEDAATNKITLGNDTCIRVNDYEFYSADGTTWKAIKVELETAASGNTPAKYKEITEYTYEYKDGAWTAEKASK